MQTFQNTVTIAQEHPDAFLGPHWPST